MSRTNSSIPSVREESDRLRNNFHGGILGPQHAIYHVLDRLQNLMLNEISRISAGQ
jgi:hypothetical protein